MNVQTTPNVNQKKRELSSPEFEIDTKKNKQHLSASSESDLDISDISVTALDTIKESTESTETTESSDMASNISLLLRKLQQHHLLVRKLQNLQQLST